MTGPHAAKASPQDDAPDTNSPGHGERYAPRKARFEGIVGCGDVPVKLTTITAPGTSIDNAALGTAREKIAQAAEEVAATKHEGAGFAVLHEGTEGRWLLLHWWLGGGIAARKLWRADPRSGSSFADTDPHLMACVWELGVIDFERRAWIDTVMSGETLSAYLDRAFSGETV